MVSAAAEAVAGLFVAHGATLVIYRCHRARTDCSRWCRHAGAARAFGNAIVRRWRAGQGGDASARVRRSGAERRPEAILHPLIRAGALRCEQATGPYVILAVPLLVESRGATGSAATGFSLSTATRRRGGARGRPQRHEGERSARDHGHSGIARPAAGGCRRRRAQQWCA